MSPHLLAQSLSAQAAQPTGGGTTWLLPLMLVAMVLLLWLPMRRQRKAMAQVKQKQSAMGPGTEVMTNYGLYGTVRSIDRDANKVVLEIAPGTQVTVHLQTVTTVVEDPAVHEVPGGAEDPAVPGTATGRTATEPTAGTGPAAPGDGDLGGGSTAAEPRDDDARREPGTRHD